jgi:hypothetical protein
MKSLAWFFHVHPNTAQATNVPPWLEGCYRRQTAEAQIEFEAEVPLALAHNLT